MKKNTRSLIFIILFLQLSLPCAICGPDILRPKPFGERTQAPWSEAEAKFMLAMVMALGNAPDKYSTCVDMLISPLSLSQLLPPSQYAGKHLEQAFLDIANLYMEIRKLTGDRQYYEIWQRERSAILTSIDKLIALLGQDNNVVENGLRIREAQLRNFVSGKLDNLELSADEIRFLQAIDILDSRGPSGGQFVINAITGLSAPNPTRDEKRRLTAKYLTCSLIARNRERISSLRLAMIEQAGQARRVYFDPSHTGLRGVVLSLSVKEKGIRNYLALQAPASLSENPLEGSCTDEINAQKIYVLVLNAIGARTTNSSPSQRVVLRIKIPIRIIINSNGSIVSHRTTWRRGDTIVDMLIDPLTHELTIQDSSQSNPLLERFKINFPAAMPSNVNSVLIAYHRLFMHPSPGEISKPRSSDV